MARPMMDALDAQVEALPTRRPDWEYRLAVAFERRPAGFIFGTADCWLFAANCIYAMTNRDPMAKWRGRYKTQRHALRLLKQHYNGDAGAFWSECLGQPVSWPSARRGDLVEVKLPDYDGPQLLPAVGIVAINGREIGCMVEDGFSRVPLREEFARRAWRVG